MTKKRIITSVVIAVALLTGAFLVAQQAIAPASEAANNPTLSLASRDAVFPLLSDNEKMQWQQRLEGTVNVAQTGGGFGPAVGETMDLSTLSALGENSLSNQGPAVVLAGSYSCQECVDTLQLIATLVENTDVTVVFITHSVNPSELEAFSDQIEIVIDFPATPLSLSPVDTLFPTLFLVNDGVVAYRADAGLMTSQHTRAALAGFIETQEISESPEVLRRGQTPKTDITVATSQGDIHLLPGALDTGTHLIYVFDPLCAACEASIDGILSMLDGYPDVQVWVLVPQHFPERNALINELQDKFPRVLVGWVEATSTSSETENSHPLSQWSQILTPGTLIFQDGNYITSVLTIINQWQSLPSAPDASVYVEATDLILSCARSDPSLEVCAPPLH